MVVQGRLRLLGFRPKRLYRVFLGSLILGSLSKEPLQKANKIKRKKKVPELGHSFDRLEKRNPPGRTALGHLVVRERFSRTGRGG